MEQLCVLITMTLILIFGIKWRLNFHFNNSAKIKFIKNSFCFIINNKTYKYSDIKKITIDENIGDYTFLERCLMGDLDNGRMINDRINFVLTDAEIIQSVETYNRAYLFKILKTVSKFKKIDFDINYYKPPFVTNVELICVIFTLIIVYHCLFS